MKDRQLCHLDIIMPQTSAHKLKSNSLPDADGHYGIYGGRYVAETLMPLLHEVEEAWHASKQNDAFQKEFNHHCRHFIGRPTPLYEATRLADYLRKQTGKKLTILFKREDLNHTGAHKINNCLGQILLARQMGKTRIIAETGAGQHGVATATVCARFGLACHVYMGAKDIARQEPNVFRMRLMGAEVIPVHSGSQTLKDALNEALRDWVAHVDDTFYIIGTVAGPHPYPAMVRDFQSVIGQEARTQCLEQYGALPNKIVACVGGGSNAIGIFHAFYHDDVTFIGVEAGGRGTTLGDHAASINGGQAGILHGNRSYFLQSKDGQIADAHSIAAGLDYPGIGPEHAFLHESGRAHYVTIDDKTALKAFALTAQLEGILPALETSHALAYLIYHGDAFADGDRVILNMSGRGDKDVFTASDALKDSIR